MHSTGGIFISHAPEDNALCEPLLDALRVWSADFWFVAARTETGPELAQIVMQAIAARPIFIRVCTNAIHHSPWVGLETGAFRRLHIAPGKPYRWIDLTLDPHFQHDPNSGATVTIDGGARDSSVWIPELQRALDVDVRSTGSLPIVAPTPQAYAPPASQPTPPAFAPVGSQPLPSAYASAPLAAPSAPLYGAAPSVTVAGSAPSAPLFPPAPTGPAPKKGVSRRGLLLGAGIGVMALAAGYLGYEKLTGQRGLLGALNQTPSPTASATPITADAGTILYVFRGHRAKVFGAAWSPDSQRLVSGAAGNDAASAPCAAANAGYDTTARVWNATDGSGEKDFTRNACGIRAVAWSHQGQRIASASDDPAVMVWDATSLAVAASYTGHTKPVRAVAWSPDDHLIASAGNDEQAHVWNAASGGLIARCVGHTSFVTGAAWSPDGTQIVTAGGDGTARIWNPNTGKQLSVYKGHNGHVFRAFWSPDGRLIASTGHDGTVQVWAPGSNTLVKKFVYPQSYKGHALYPLALAWSPDGRYLVFGGGSDIPTYDAHVNTNITVWDWQADHVVLTYSGHKLFVDVIAWSPDGQRIASASDDSTVQVWAAPR